MKSFIEKYHLKEGALIAIIFPLVFIPVTGNTSNVVVHFISVFIVIFGLWLTNFILIDFKGSKRKYQRNRLLNKYSRFIVSFLAALMIYFIVGSLIDSSGTLLTSVENGSSNLWIFLSLKILIFNAVFILIKYVYDTNSEKKQIAIENEILKRENINAQHETLKQQVNPHFLFNSLNTLKSLIKQDASQAGDFIDELSSVYRYMLLHQDKKDVTIGEEIDFLKSYVYLLKIRFGSAINTEITLPDSLMQYSMPPNTLQLLIENAVKHNALSTKKPLSIYIYARDNYLTVQNNLQSKPELPAPSSQFGLSNISSRYLLLKGKDIMIEKTDTSFLVSLPII